MKFIIPTTTQGQLIFEDIDNLYTVDIRDSRGQQLAIVEIPKDDIRRLAKAT